MPKKALCGLKVTFWDKSPLLLLSEAELPIAQLAGGKVFNKEYLSHNIFREIFIFELRNIYREKYLSLNCAGHRECLSMLFEKYLSCICEKYLSLNCTHHRAKSVEKYLSLNWIDLNIWRAGWKISWEIFIVLPCWRRGGSFPVLFSSCSCPTCWLLLYWRVSSGKPSSGLTWSDKGLSGPTWSGKP